MRVLGSRRPGKSGQNERVGRETAIVAALPMPILLVGLEYQILHANQAAEQFFDMGVGLLMKQKLGDLLPFGSPLLQLIGQARERGASIAERNVDLSTPRLGERVADVTLTPTEDGAVIVLLQERGLAHRIDRQLLYRGAARSMSGMAAVLAHEIKNPLAGIRGAHLGVILDWVPGHFPNDPHGLARFDGTALYEHEDPREGLHRDWNTCIYNFGRSEVQGFLIASALYWLTQFHIDGLRVDAVASMLYRDYSREPGEWIPNRYGGRENLEAIEFLRRLNAIVAERCPGAITIAEDSTAWPGVTAPVSYGGLGFSYKWNMGWMHDTLRYLGRDAAHRKWHHDDLTFGLL